MQVQTLISPHDTWALWAILLTCATLGLWSERRRFGARYSSAMVTMLLAFLLSNLGVIPAKSSSYDMVWSYMVPLAIPLLLLNVDLRRTLMEAGPTLLAFALGTVGTLLAVLLAYLLLPLGTHDWQLAAAFSANYIGGAMNYLSVASHVGLPAHLRQAGVAIEHLVMLVYLLIMLTLPALYRFRARFHERPQNHRIATEIILRHESRTGERINLPGISAALSMSLIICTLGFYMQRLIGWPGSALLIITLLSIIPASVPGKRIALDGAPELGTLLMQILFAVIGAGAHVASALKAGPMLLSFAGIILVGQLLFTLYIGRYIKLSLPELLIAANANLGNPATAVAMAAARRWEALIVPAVLCGTLGYAAATWLGTIVGRLLK